MAARITDFAELPTRPLECWEKLKEFRRKFFFHTWEAKKRGDVLLIGAGTLSMFNSLIAGLGDACSLAHGIYFARLMRNKEEAIRCHEAADARGYSRDLCSTLRLGLGQQFTGILNRTPTGEYVNPDFALEPVICVAQSKTAKAMAENFGIPFLAFDVPVVTDYEDEAQKKRAVDFLVAQMNDIIERMEKATGKKYDDEKLIEGVYNEWRSTVYYGKLCLLQRNIPAPLDQRMLESLCAGVYIAGKHRPETAELLKLFLDETEERVREGISALGIERARLLHEGQAMYYNIRFYRYPLKYGAVFIGGRFIYSTHGAYTINPDGSWGPARTLEERGVVLKDREDALRSLSELALFHFANTRMHNTPFKVKEHIKMAQDWNVHGVVFHLDLGCKMVSSVHMEARTALHRMGIPTMVYEASSSDPRDLSPAQLSDRMDSFLESLGLTRIAG